MCPNDSAGSIRRLFEPRSVAVIGASHDREKIGYKILENIHKGGYGGTIVPVNPRGGEILGIPVFTDLEAVPGEVDVAVVTVPAKFVHAAVEACARKGVRYLLVITSGFSEVGNLGEEQKMVSLAREAGMRIVGPNMFGLYSAAVSMNATFGPGTIRPGGVAIISQSGALGLAMIGKTWTENVGLSAICSVGNKADVDEADLLEYLVPQEDTRVILMYIEGVKQGEKFIEALRKATAAKPVIVVKSGRSARGAAAAASHTGSLAGSDRVFDAVARQCGALRAETVKEAFDWCKYLSATPLPDGEETVIVTNGGGMGVLATDACEKFGIRLYDDLEILKDIFTPVTPEFGSVRNPVDLTGGARSGDYNDALGAALEREDIHAVIALYCETAVFDAERLPEMVRGNYSRYGGKAKPITFSLFGGESTEKAMARLSRERVPVYGDVYEAISPLGALYAYHHYLKGRAARREPPPAVDGGAIRAITAPVRAEGRYFLLAAEAQKLVGTAGIPVPRTRIASSLEEALEASREIGYPVVMKVVSPDIIHKSDAGGVALDLENDREAMDAYEAILRSCRTRVPGARIQGVEVTEMVRGGTEMIVGAKKDPSFGPIVMAGLGGIYVEVMKDVAFRSYPLDRGEVLAMIREIRSYPLLLGVRGESPKDIRTLVDTILLLGEIVSTCRDISDIEINPLVVYDEGWGARAVDVRILLSKEERE
ncbi:MAG TPA: acetate--CoA ligase family protein [Syntrophales bacterium]|nr:acetate--CoA ligase family protein [Syntrophales bacterium]